jgi:outer membrane protein assembly factor BamB
MTMRFFVLAFSILGFLFLLQVTDVNSQGSPLEEYKNTCTISETDITIAAKELGVTEEEIEFANQVTEYFEEDYLIRPGCFFSTELARNPLYAYVSDVYPFMIEIVEADLAFSQIVPDGYFGSDGYSSYRIHDFTAAEDDAGRWVYTGMAVLTGGAAFGGHGIAISGGGFQIYLEHDWIGQTFLYTTLVPEGPMLTVQAGYLLEGEIEEFGLFAIDYESGEYLWDVELSGDAQNVIAASPEEAIVIYDDHLTVHDSQDGQEMWMVELETPLAAATADTLIALSKSTLSAYDMTGGKILWEVDVPEGDYTHLVQTGENVIAAMSNGTITAHQIEDGEMLWQIESSVALTTVDLECDETHDCWLLSAGNTNAVVEQFSVVDGQKFTEYDLPGETNESELRLRVQTNGWILITGNHLHARTMMLNH